MPGWRGEFTYDELQRLLDALVGRFSVRPLGDAMRSTEATGVAFLRHDIDLDLQAALPVAEMESRLGITASYLVMTTSPTYDLLSTASRKIVEEISAFGHEIGLHADPPARVASDPAELEAFVAHDAARVEDVAGTRVPAVSFHKPVEALLRGPLQIAGRVNAYADRLMRTYVSDSRGRWRVDDPIAILTGSTEPWVQLLVHPIWWGPSSVPAADRLEALFVRIAHGMSEQGGERLDRALEEHLTIRRRGASSG